MICASDFGFAAVLSTRAMVPLDAPCCVAAPLAAQCKGGTLEISNSFTVLRKRERSPCALARVAVVGGGRSLSLTAARLSLITCASTWRLTSTTLDGGLWFTVGGSRAEGGVGGSDGDASVVLNGGGAVLHGLSERCVANR